MTCKRKKPGFGILLLVVCAIAACAEEPAELSLLEQGKAQLSAGNGIGAEKLLQQALEQGTPKPNLAAYLGESELQQGQLAEARYWLGEAEFDDESRAHGFHMLARLEMQEGNLPAAGRAFDAALAINRDDAELWVDIGRLRYRGGEQLLAIEAAELAVKLGPDNARALHFRGQLVRDAYGSHAALPWFRKAHDLSPQDGQILADLAGTQGELGEAKAMLVSVRKLSKVDPGNPHILKLQAILAARVGNSNLARNLLQRTGSTGADTLSASDMLLSAVVDLQNGNHASATQALDNIANLQPENARVQNLLALALFLGGNDGELVHRFENNAQQKNASRYLLTLVGRAHERLGNREMAATFLDRGAQAGNSNLVGLAAAQDMALAARTGNDSELGTVALIRAYIGAGQPQDAAMQAQKFLARFPGSADALGLAGDARLAAGNTRAALNLYHKSASIRRPWPLARRMIAAEQASRNTEAAIGLTLSELRGAPGNFEAAKLYAGALTEVQEWEKAATILDHSFGHGGVQDPNMLAMRVNAAMRLGRIDEALAFAEWAYALQPNSALTTSMLVAARNAAGLPAEPTKFLAAKARALGRN